MYKHFITVAVLMFSFCTYGIGTIEELRDKVHETFKNEPLVIQAVLKYLDSKIALNSALSDKAQFIAAGKRNMKDAYCVHFVAYGDEKTLEKFAAIVGDFGSIDEFKDFDKKDFALRMNRDIREQIGAEVKGVELIDKHKFCTIQLSASDIEDLKKKIIAEDARFEREYKKATFDEFHPALRPLLLYQQKTFKQSNPKMSDSQVDNQIYELFMKYIMQTLDMKAGMEVLPKIEKQCKGIVEKTWAQCDNKEFFNSLVKTIAPSLMRHLCLIDHTKQIVPRCIAEKDFQLTNLPATK
ncbi:MAG: hypothetical protein A2X86_06105 [Bdellovibrionales bacterium GWA2_49_15]|nr:MAG: hypothetical protein A2X86_06105 [Bdellovibrionales bacterium GWA2_49_15]HAZ14635.1 hypothetical protein [Bdellovibrionales bacterium]